MGEIKLLDGKKVAIVSHYFPPESGAAANRMNFFAYWLHKHGAQVDIITAMPNYPEGIVHEEYKKTVWKKESNPWGTVLRTWCYASPKRSAIRRLFNYFTFMFLSLRWLRRVKRSDVVIFSSGPMFSGLVAFLSAKFFGTKVILDVRDLWPDRIWETGAIRLPRTAKNILYAYEKFMYQNSVLAMGVTQGICDAIHHRVGADLPIELIRNCDQEINLDKGRHCFSRKTNGSPVIVEAGTLGWAQDPETLCIAYEELLSKGIQNISLKFAGSGPRVDAIKKHITDSKDACYLGNLSQEKLWATLISADIGVVTLKATEHNKMAVSRRIYDYARAGLAIIYSGEGEGAEIIETSGAGIVVPPEDSQALADAIEQLVVDKEALKLWQENSRLLLEGEFSPSSVGTFFVRLVRECCDK